MLPGSRTGAIVVNSGVRCDVVQHARMSDFMSIGWAASTLFSAATPSVKSRWTINGISSFQVELEVGEGAVPVIKENEFSVWNCLLQCNLSGINRRRTCEFVHQFCQKVFLRSTNKQKRMANLKYWILMNSLRHNSRWTRRLRGDPLDLRTLTQVCRLPTWLGSSCENRQQYIASDRTLW